MEDKLKGCTIPTNLRYCSKMAGSIEKLLLSRIFNGNFSDMKYSKYPYHTRRHVFIVLILLDDCPFGGSM